MDISLVHTKDLLKELEGRFDSSVFCTWKFTGKEDLYDYHIHGNRLMCGQLARFMAKKIDADMVAEETEGFGIDD